MKLDIKKLGLAFGFTFAGLYLACVVFMMFASRETIIFLSNSLMHGIDVTPIIRMNVPLCEAILGFVCMLVFGGIMGIAIGWIYNNLDFI